MTHEHLHATDFDPTVGAWVVCRHAEVAAALRDHRLTVAGGAADAAPPAAPPEAEMAARQAAAHQALRTATGQALAPTRTTAWRPVLAATAQQFVGDLPVGVPVDLVTAFARPWALVVAATVTELPVAEATRLAGLAHTVFCAAAQSTDGAVAATAATATVALARALQATAGWPDVQAFVALSQTLPSVLAGAWRTLLERPEVLRGLRAQPTLAPGVTEELLRHGGPTRAVFRQAVADLTLGEARIAAGDRVVLRLAAANHDPARFAEPERLDVARASAGHLAFGAGRHRCPGAPVIRLALDVATIALLEGTGEIIPLAGACGGDGYAIRDAGTLPVRLSRADG